MSSRSDSAAIEMVGDIATSDLTMGRVLGGISRFGDRIALICDGASISYTQLRSAADDLVSLLSSAELRKGDRFAFLLPNGFRIVECYIACAISGIVGVPLSTRTTADDVLQQIVDSGARAVLYAAEWTELVEEIRGRASDVVQWIPEAEADGLVVEPATTLRSTPRLEPSDPFCVMYTGGSTGTPKGAIQTQLAWGAGVWEAARQFGLTQDDRHAVVLPMTYSAWFSVAAHLLVGAVTHIQRRWDPVALLDLVESERLTMLHMIPTLFGDLVGVSDLAERDVASVRLLTLAGSPIPMEHYRKAVEVFGPVIGNMYGMTEAAGSATYLMPPEATEQTIRSAGRPSSFVEARIEAEGETAGGNPAGELLLRGPQITPGYLNRPDETAEALRGGWFHTGDVGYFDADGLLYLVGRSKDMVKTGGLNVYPKEVEDVLFRHPAVVDVAVIGVPDQRWIEAVAAVVVLSAGERCSAQELIDFARNGLAGYKVPRIVHFADALPRTSIGKLDKPALRALYAAQPTP